MKIKSVFHREDFAVGGVHDTFDNQMRRTFARALFRQFPGLPAIEIGEDPLYGTVTIRTITAEAILAGGADQIRRFAESVLPIWLHVVVNPP